MLPSIKTLSTIAPERATELRKVLEIDTRAQLEETLESGRYPAALAMYKRCFNPMPLTVAKLNIADEILGTFGVEHIDRGQGRKSPAIAYCNTGDTYKATLLYVYGLGYRVGSWGDIVERGQYA